MKIGILCEGERTDQPVLELVIKTLFPRIDLYVKGTDKKVIFTAADLEIKKIDYS